MIQKRLKIYVLTAAIILSLILYNLEYPISHWLTDREEGVYIPGGHKEGVSEYSRLEQTQADQYDFLYGKEFEAALDRASQKPKKNILFWHPQGDLNMAFSTTMGRTCGFCNVVDDLSLIEDENTAAVVFYHDNVLPEHMPQKRNPNQYWIWRTGEAPPAMVKAGTVPYAEKVGFNLTMSYRQNSDIRIYYGYFSEMSLPDTDQILKNKDNLAMIVTSDCSYIEFAKVRMQLIQMLLSEGLRLTTSGACFPNSPQFSRNADDELLKATSRYKFYLAFENSYHCKDYVSEKFFRAIRAGTVPVVWGAKKEDYMKFLPESGFVFVEDYPTTKDLIAHLNYLDKNDDEYLKYFEWRKRKPNNANEQTFICQLCRFLHGINVDDAYVHPYAEISKDPQSYIKMRPEKRTVDSIRKWLLDGDNSECLKAGKKLNRNGKVVL